MRTVNVVLLPAEHDGEAVANHRFWDRGFRRMWKCRCDKPIGKKEEHEEEAPFMVQNVTSNWPGPV